MTAIKAHQIQLAFRLAGVLVGVLITVLLVPPPAYTAALPLGDEQDGWSDLLLPSATGVFDSGTLTIFRNTVPGDLEIGSQFGPSNPGRQYGTGGTLGGEFNVSLSISRLHVTAAGDVADQETIMILSYEGGAAGSLGTDYGINTGRSLLRGTAQEVLLDAAGDNTLDILFSITSGDLQNLPNQQAPLGKFAPGNLALIRITAPNLPSNWSSNFNFTATSLHIFGIPEPTSFALLALIGPVLTLARRRPAKETPATEAAKLTMNKAEAVAPFPSRTQPLSFPAR